MRPRCTQPTLRKGSKAPYLSHLLEVCAIVLRYGGGEDAAIAAFLHDAAEDHGGKPRLVDIQRKLRQDRRRYRGGVHRLHEDPEGPLGRPEEGVPAAPAQGVPRRAAVSAADKLSNVRALLADHYVIGDEVYKRFNRPKRRTLWYYNALGQTFSTHLRGDLAKELAARCPS